MDPKRARSASNTIMSKEDLRSLSELWRMAKTHSMDWALQKLSGAPKKNPQSGQDHPFQSIRERSQRITGIPFQGLQRHAALNQRTQLLRESPQGIPQQKSAKGRVVNATQAAKAQSNPREPGPQEGLSLGQTRLR
ncbi:hypothetical protein NDU88_007448 [Pleurodeles waltl]|uniref:Uncharacterized protein n=1 Tax=Pleurodeles waltl TaxID=8319 RepID=A0AAV7MG51_PLEWA|nr:hypothetical protein NDU88_007448 [Pleurodeles waltl]